MTKSSWYRRLALFLCLYSFSSFAAQLLDSENFLYDLGKDAVLQRGSLDAFSNMYRLRVNRANYTGTLSSFSPSGREARYGIFTEPGSGLEVERWVYVPKMLNFARYSEILRNTGTTDRTIDVEVYGNLGGNVELISSQENFLITRAKTNSVVTPPSILHYHSQAGSTLKPKVSLTNNQLSWIYTVTVPAKTTVRLVYFVAQTRSNEIAKQLAGFIFGNPSVLYEQMDTTLRSQLLNFSAPAVNITSDFSNVPYLTVGEVRKSSLTNASAQSHRRLNTVAETYALPLTAGQQVTIRMSAAFNTYLYLFNDVAGTNQVASNDNPTADTNNAEIVFTAPQAGTYYIEATTYDAYARGDYSLEILSGLASRAPQVMPIEMKADNLTAPATINFSDFSTGNAIGSNIIERCWQFGDGSAVNCSATNTVSHIFSQAGRYTVTLIVKDDQGLRASRSLPITIAAAATGVVLPVSNTVSGELATSDNRSQTRSGAFSDRYRVSSISAGQELTLELTANNFEGFLYVYDSNNQLLRQGTRRVRYTPWQSGDLFIEATSTTDNTLGTYNLSVNPATVNDANNFVIEASASPADPLQNLIVARLPESFKPTFLTWNFGDGTPITSSSDSVVSHRYARAGQFTASVTAANAQQQSVSSTQRLTITTSNVAPTARFRNTPLFGEKPLRVFFSNESSSSVADDSLSYLWQFGDGEVSTDSHPGHTFTQAGTYNVTLQVTSAKTAQTTSYSAPVSVIERSTATDVVVGAVKLRPQVLLAGFDPMIVDINDTNIKVFALVRMGNAPIQTVRLLQNGTSFALVLQQVATYPNGEQRYEAVYPFTKGALGLGKITNFFGDQTGQLRIQAIDQSGQFHTFPNLEVGNNPNSSSAPSTLHVEPVRQWGIHRAQAQVLAAGFDPVLIDAADTQMTVKAIVREGLYPIQSVSLQHAQSGINLPMRWQDTLPNGDQLYILSYAYPRDTLPITTFGNLWGEGAGVTGWSVLVTDQAQQSHRYPEMLVGNFAPL